MPGELTLSDFAPHLHTRFRVEQLKDFELELVEAADHSNASLEQFSLVFTGMASPFLQQGMYRLLHPQMQECELFLVPIGPGAAGMRYEAVFSRLIRGRGTPPSA